jgi:Ion channel
MERLFFTAAGFALLVFVARDVHITILHSSGRNGPLSRLLARSIWRIARWSAFKLSRQRRHRRLNSVGPVLMPALVGLYILLLILGFALIYYPHMPEHFTLNANAASGRWIESFYFSGITLTTLGYGDIVPRTNMMRVLVFVEAGAGFGLISLSITYLLTVYGALERKRTAAMAFYHEAEGGADVVGFVSNHFVAGKLSGLAASMRMAARDLQETLESHVEHPILHYFHPAQVYKSLPRVLFLSLEICAVIKSCLNSEEYNELHERPEVRILESSALHVLIEFTALLDLDEESSRRAETRFEEARRWKGRFEQTLARLEEIGIKTREDRAAGWKVYQALRYEWEPQLYALASYLGYDWDEVTGDKDLEYAADEEMEQPRLEATR